MVAVLDAGYMSFDHWTKKHDKIYDSKTVEDERKKLWEQNLEFVKQHNAEYLAGKHSYRIQQTRCSDETHEEMMKWMSCELQPTAVSSRVIGGSGGGCGDPGMTYDSKTVEDERKKLLELFEPVKQRNKEFVFGKTSNPIQQNSGQTKEEMMSCESQPTTALPSVGNGGGGDGGGGGGGDERNPDRVDWRERGCVTPVKDQRPLPACWIFAAVSAVESHNAITNGKLVELSVQQLVDCIGGGDKKGSVKNALEYIAKHGSIRESDYSKKVPFQLGDCTEAGKKVEVNLDPLKYVKVNNSEKCLETAVAHIGPVAVTLLFPNHVQLSKFSSSNYKDVFYEPGPYDTKQIEAHAVLVVGYGYQPNKTNTGMEKYWIIKNSCGCDENTGYHKLAKDRSNNCFVASCALYPIVKKSQKKSV